MKIAIVGSEEKYWTPETRAIAVRRIRDILNSHALCYGDGNAPEYNYEDLIMVSGACPKGGIDIWAEIVCDILEIEKKIFPAGVEQWNDELVAVDGGGFGNRKGYKSCNIEIATTCDIIYCIDRKDRKTSGGQWTMGYASKLGKKSTMITIWRK